ncbi:Asp-tRNA(Asn)/Glu-tRNA(Gln) amidotransferase subunit GatC [Candidatus Falkowbacteria bacterium]|nr:Asp-tRNA(Asn)/Glu-tRNA(Gln) amidotransferase subunit GatC [Candidatus Falkowbacteria bacterium]
MHLTKQEIEHVAKLARLELTEEEVTKYGEQLSAVLSYIDQLSEVDTAGVEPTAQVTGLENVWREDQVEVWDETQTRNALELAPELEDGQIKVKRILE